MNTHDATEQAYKRGYEDGLKHGTGGQKMANEKPCLTCTTVADPEKCGNINCKAWCEWFLKKWDELRGRRTDNG